MKIFNGKKFYTIQDVANKLNMAYPSTWQWINRDHKSEMVKIGRSYYLPEATFNNLTDI